MLRLAYFSPLPPARSGIADYSRDLLPELAAHAAITLYADEPEAVDADLRSRFAVRPIACYPAERWGYDAALYQMGNSAHHAAGYEMMRRYPGVVALHDYNLHHFFTDSTIGRGNFAAYGRELGYALGEDGARLARGIRRGTAVHPFAAVPLNDRLLDVSLGLIVHSRYARERIVKKRPSLPTKIIPQLIQMDTVSPHRPAAGWPDDAIIFASVGQITPTKGIEAALRALSAIRASFPQARYLLVGENRMGEALDGLIEELGLTAVVCQTGHVEALSDFLGWIAAADAVVNLRNPTVGETSATALRSMGAGRPLIVYDHGWYSEIPDAACIKIAPDDERGLAAALEKLAGSAALRQKMGDAGRNYVRTECDPKHAAAEYMRFLERLLATYRNPAS